MVIILNDDYLSFLFLYADRKHRDKCIFKTLSFKKNQFINLHHKN